jgi:hypothetical protein
VRQLQLSGPYLLGGADSRNSSHLGGENLSIDSWFLLDTRTGKSRTFSNKNDLQATAVQAGITLNLDPIYSIYSRYRFTWFDIVTAVALFLPPSSLPPSCCTEFSA